MSEVKNQIWQSRILADILNSEDSTYNKEYVMPRGSGVSTLFLTLLKEFDILFTNSPMKIIMVVPTQNHKRYLESFQFAKKQVQATKNKTKMLVQMGLLQQVPEDEEETDIGGVLLVSAQEDPAAIAGKFPNYIDWLLVDSVPEGNAIVDYLSTINVNNSLKIRTV